ETEAGVPDASGEGEGPTIGRPVDPSEVRLVPIVPAGVPGFAPITGYDVHEEIAAQTDPPRQAPLYAPYDGSGPGWDNIIAEQLQARVSYVLLPTGGTASTDPNDTKGDLNPHKLAGWWAAVQRAGATTLFVPVCRVDTPSFRALANSLHDAAPGSPLD